MIAVLLTRALTKDELWRDWRDWHSTHVRPPNVIVGPDDLAYAFPEQSAEETTFQGVMVITLRDFWNLNVELVGGDDGDDEP